MSALQTQYDHNRIVKFTPKRHTQLALLQKRIVTHHPHSGVNPIIDAAGPLFSLLGRLKAAETCPPQDKLRQELNQKLQWFEQLLQNQGSSTEYILICKHVITTTFDDVLNHLGWGNNIWHDQTLSGDNLPPKENFFLLMEYALKEPALYMDLLELMYICLSMGYKGAYRNTEQSRFELEQITHNLYKYIQAYRNSQKALPEPPKTTPKETPLATENRPAYGMIFLVTASIIMTIFIGLGYLLDIISNEATRNIATIQKPVSLETQQHG